MQQNKQLQGTALQDAANQQGYDASFVALVLFPDVLNMLAGNIDWTTELGTAFLSDQKGVMDSVQKLRAQAQTVGNLKTTPQQEVSTESKDGQKTIVIQPANPQVVYVPVYNTQTVYTTPPPATPTTSASSSSDSGKTAAAALIGFGLGVAIGSSMNNHYYAPYGWGAWGMGWHTHTVVVVGKPWGVPPYARYPYVRPVAVPYGGYRPATNVYAPKNINVNNVNVNRNVYAGATPRPQPYSSASRPTTTSAARPSTTQVQRPATASNTRPPATQSQRPATTPGSRPTSQPATNNQRPAPSSAARTTDYGSRGYGQSVSQSPSNNRPADRAQTSSSAFSGYQSGNTERTASQRGQRSVTSSKARTSPSRR